MPEDTLYGKPSNPRSIIIEKLGVFLEEMSYVEGQQTILEKRALLLIREALDVLLSYKEVK